MLSDFIDVMNFIFIANDMWMLWTAFILGGAFIWKIKKSVVKHTQKKKKNRVRVVNKIKQNNNLIKMKQKRRNMNKLFLVLALLFTLSACTATLGKKCTYTQEGTKISSWVWIYSAGKPVDLDKNNCN